MVEDSEQVRVAFKLTKDEFEEFIKLCNTLDKNCDQPLGDIVLKAMRLYECICKRGKEGSEMGNKTMSDLPVRKIGSGKSKSVTITRLLKNIGAEDDEVVRVTIERISEEVDE